MMYLKSIPYLTPLLVLTTASVPPTRQTPQSSGPFYHLRTSVISGDTSKNNLYVTTAAGHFWPYNTATILNSTLPTTKGTFNTTSSLFIFHTPNLTSTNTLSLPYAFGRGGESWDEVATVPYHEFASSGGSATLSVANGELSTGQGGFWLACDWNYNAAQLFWGYESGKSGKLPKSCAKVKLLLKSE